MPKSFDPKSMARREFDEHIRALQVVVDRERERLDAAIAELEWWEQGRELFAPEAKSARPPESRVTTLRQAVLAVMRDSNASSMRVLDIIAALHGAGWMPSGKNADDVVRGMVSTMTKQKQLVRVAYGTYSLPDRLPNAANGALIANPEELSTGNLIQEAVKSPSGDGTGGKPPADST